MAGKTETHTADWLVYSREHNAWWRANRSGYTNDIAQAGRYSKAEAEGCCNKRDEQQDGSPSEVAVIAPEAGEQLARADAAEALLSDWLPALSAVHDGEYNEHTGKMVLTEDQWTEISEAAAAFRAFLGKNIPSTKEETV